MSSSSASPGSGSSGSGSILDLDDPDAVMRALEDVRFTPSWTDYSITIPDETLGQGMGQGMGGAGAGKEGLAERVNPYFDWFSWAFNENA